MFSGISQQIGQKEIGVKTGGKEKTRITAVLTVLADGSKLPPLLIFKGQPSSSNKSRPANNIEREFENYKDKKGYAYPRCRLRRGPKAWHSQRVFDNQWIPQVWRQRPGRLSREHGYRQPDTLLAWDDYTVHKTAASTEAMAESNTTLFLVPGGLTPKLQPCDGLVNKLFKAHMSRLDDDHMSSPEVGRDKNGYPEAPSRGLLARWVKKSWGGRSADGIRARWKKAGLLPFDGSEDEAWANKELGADAQGKPLDADDSAAAAGADQSEPTSNAANLMEVLEIADYDETGVEVLEISDTEEDV